MSALASLARTIGRFGRNRIPPQLVVQITNRCNALCPQCGMRRSADIARFDLPAAVMERILGDCAAKGVQAISFTGGEPLRSFWSSLDSASAEVHEGMDAGRRACWAKCAAMGVTGACGSRICAITTPVNSSTAGLRRGRSACEDFPSEPKTIAALTNA